MLPILSLPKCDTPASRATENDVALTFVLDPIPLAPGRAYLTLVRATGLCRPMPPANTSRPLDLLAISLMILFCASWSLQQAAAKLAMPEVASMTQAAIRSTGATFAVALWMAWRSPEAFRADGSMPLGLWSGFLFALEFFLLFLGLQWTTASHAVLFLYTSPFWVALGIGLFVPNERLRPLQWFGLALSFAGVAMALGVSSYQSRQQLTGDLLCLMAGAVWGSITVTVRVTSLRHVHAGKLMLYQLGISAVLLSIAAWALGDSWPTRISTFALSVLLYQTFWVAAVTFVGWMWLVTIYRSAELASFGFLTPVLGVIAGWAIMGDPLTPQFIVAVVLVAAGIVLVNRRAAN